MKSLREPLNGVSASFFHGLYGREKDTVRILNIDGLYLVPAFRRLGAEVLTLGSAPGCEVFLERPLSLKGLTDLLTSRGFTPDLVFWADVCRPPSVVGFENFPAVTLGYSIDSYCNPWHIPYGAAFDAMFAAQKDYVRFFDDAPITRPTAWLPLFADPDTDQDLGLDRDIPVSFVGTVTGSINTARKAFLARFKRRCPLFVLTGDYGSVFGRSRLVLNQSAAGELNFRVFQAMACGAALLTEDTGNGLNDLFTPGQDLLVYPRDDDRAAAALAHQALEPENAAALAEMAVRGRDQVRAKHGADQRAAQVLAMARRLAAEGAPRRRLAALDLIRPMLANASFILASDEALPLPPDHRAFYAELGRLYLLA